MTSSRVILGLGSNLGSRTAFLRSAAAMLHAIPGVSVVAASPVWETAPLGPAQPNYLNAALDLATALRPADLLGCTQGIEQALGRVRRTRWGPRTLDLDILWWEGVGQSSSALSIPHPGLTERAFALDPLLALAPDLRDPAGIAYAAHRARLPATTSAPWPWADRSWGLVTPEGSALWVEAADEADGLAAAAEAWCTLAHLPTASALRVCLPLDVAVTEDTDPSARLNAWLTAVAACLQGRFALGRAVVYETTATRLLGALWGQDDPSAAPTPPAIAATASLSPAGWRATLRR